MQSGRELDALIAEKVMGYLAFATSALRILGKHVMEDYIDNSPCIVCGRRDDTLECLPHYSTDIAAAWEVVEKMVPEISAFSLSYGSDGYCACFESETAWASTATHAICLAALKAVKFHSDKAKY